MVNTEMCLLTGILVRTMMMTMTNPKKLKSKGNPQLDLLMNWRQMLFWFHIKRAVLLKPIPSVSALVPWCCSPAAAAFSVAFCVAVA